MIGIIGAGAFGTSLAVSLAQNGPVTAWVRDETHAAVMRTTRENARRLPGVQLPRNVTISADIDSVFDAEALLLCLPTQTLRGFLDTYSTRLGSAPVVTCCKGMELVTCLRPTEIVVAYLPNSTTAVMTGPSFAADIARGLPTAITLACADDAVGLYLQQTLTTPNIRLYRTQDVIGAEFGGALKNVIAIACGAAIGAGLGESARAALMTRGFAEMTRIAEAHGGRVETLAGLSGFGDLTLTCTSTQSRNYRFGQSIGEGQAFDPSVTVEGAATARALVELADKTGLDLPITRVVTKLVSGELKVMQAMNILLSRPLKEE